MTNSTLVSWTDFRQLAPGLLGAGVLASWGRGGREKVFATLSNVRVWENGEVELGFSDAYEYYQGQRESTFLETHFFSKDAHVSRGEDFLSINELGFNLTITSKTGVI